MRCILWASFFILRVKLEHGRLRGVGKIGLVLSILLSHIENGRKVKIESMVFFLIPTHRSRYLYLFTNLKTIETKELQILVPDLADLEKI